MDDQDEALRARAQARVGSTLRGKYRLDRVLGIGGMATVFAATHRNQAELAVKVLHPELSLRDDLKKRFLREGYVGNSVKHPGAVLVVDDDVAEDGSAFLVMELLRGRSLEEVWERGGRHLSVQVVTACAIQLLDVLAAAHDKLIVHRDLKPANLFLTHDGTVKVLDFGIARLRDAVGGSEHATRTGTLMGTPAFMAPEQAQAVAADIDGQTDLWAVGATMYTLLSGQLVHDGENSSQLLIRAGTSRARPLATVAPQVDARVAAVVDRALTFEKAGRWPTAAAMRDGLLAATVAALGSAPGRDVLTPLVPQEGAGGTSGGAWSSDPDRVVVSGGASGQASGNDPTFATPSGPRARETPRTGEPLAPAPALPGLSTANPVSREASGIPRPFSRVVALTGVAFLAAGAGFALFFARSSPSHPAPASASPVVSAAVTPLLTPSPVVSAPAPSAAPAPSVVPVASVASPRIPTPTASTTPAVSPTRPLRPRTTADCSSPYTLDRDGNKIWKPECLSE